MFRCAASWFYNTALYGADRSNAGRDGAGIDHKRYEEEWKGYMMESHN